MSTGMSTLDEIDEALSILEEGIKKNDLTILHRTTQYPTLVEDVNLNAMITIANKFDVKVGYSDHTQGVDIAVSAIAMGAPLLKNI